ncbi:MAG: ATP-dependent 6-phosphofructokinase [Clostridia bacterium]|nr:ATP-dependent 6-phosphofructokinase [Clostridia bacterium]
MKVKKIGILTSGGDAPGMNSALFGVYSACKDNNITLIGFKEGYNGLIDNDYVVVNDELLDGRINRGGTVLRSSRAPRFLKPNFFKKAVKNIKELKIDAMIILGGDGSIRGASDLESNGIHTICIPCTIDNDLNFSRTLGFDTATNNIVDALDNIADSLLAFGYGSVVKIMGKHCTDLLDTVSRAIQTDLKVISKDFDLNELIKKIKKQKNNLLPPVVLVLEDCVNSEELAKILQEKCKFPWRAHILGYIQRGGTPTAIDRMYGYSAGLAVVEYTMKGESGFVLGMDNDHLVKKSFSDAIKKIS